MEIALGAFLGAITGSAVAKATPALDSGSLINWLSAFLGGLAGAALLGGEDGWITGLLSGSSMGGSLIGGCIGGIVLAVVVGLLTTKPAVTEEPSSTEGKPEPLPEGGGIF